MGTNTIRAGAAVVALLLVIGVTYALLHGSAGLGSSVGSGPLPSGGSRAPEFVGITDWENGPALQISQLRGKVVLVDFWTYSCINCQRTFPFLRDWWHKYRDSGLVIVGVHSPEFDFEKSVPNIRQAITHYGVEWPVAVDSQMATWNAYQNQYWPAEYLIDKNGLIRDTHFGEGNYDQTERNIRLLLNEAGHGVLASPGASIDAGITQDANAQTRELYAGRQEFYGNQQAFTPGQPFDFHDPAPIVEGTHSDNLIYWQGRWTIHDPSQGEYAQHARSSSSGQDYALIDYRARQVFMVAATASTTQRVYLQLDGRDLAPTDAGADVRFDGSGHAYADIDRSDLFALVKRADFTRHVLTVSPTGTGFELFTFTFGS
ncbi:MAG TPA: redoxin domain-containing protein [Candidatus Dormibacteraeota bacterium]|nr:redoxin domain-containing protein [Candidatus Dormibacteraeota bacterium]